MKLVSDNTKAGRLLGWSPQVGLDDGLARTVEFVQRYLSTFRQRGYVT
jgi:dTDP-glucose 4,6-dehydratase